MTPRILLLILLCLLCTACVTSATKNAQKATQGRIQGTEAAQVDANANSGGSVVIQATQEPTALPTIDTEKAQMADDLVKLKDRVDAAEKAMNDQAERIAASYAAAAESNLQTEKQATLTEAEKAKQQHEITLQMQADNERILALAQLAEAQARKSEADAKLLLTVAIVMLSVIGGLLLMRVLARYPAHVVHETTPEPELEDFTPIDTAGIITNHVTGTPQYPVVMQYVIPSHIADAKQLEIIANVFARDGFPLSHNNFAPSLAPCPGREPYISPRTIRLCVSLVLPRARFGAGVRFPFRRDKYEPCRDWGTSIARHFWRHGGISSELRTRRMG